MNSATRATTTPLTTSPNNSTCARPKPTDRWLLELDPSQIEQLAVDGKVLRGTGRTDGKAPLKAR